MTAETLHRPVSSGQFVVRRQCDRTWKAPRPRLSVGFLLTRNFTLTALSSFMDMLRLAADDGDSSRQRHCRWTVMGLGREPVRSSCGLDIAPWDDLRDVQEFDYLVVVGGLLDDGPQLDPTTQAYLHEAVRKDVRLIGVCTGVVAVVEAGLMEGRRCCVSWYHHRDFAAKFPNHPFTADELFVVGRDRITCAGGTAAADVAAYLIERHIGAAAARKALHILQNDRARPPDQAQPQPQPLGPAAADPSAIADERIRRATLLMEQNLSVPLSVDELAQRVQVSTRQFIRLFRMHTGASPLSYYRQLRLNYARWMLTHSDESITQIALEAGFSDCAHLSRQFRTVFGIPPSSLR